MKMTGIVSQVRVTPSKNKAGQDVNYFDVFVCDMNTNPLERYPGEILLKPTAAEMDSLGIAEGKVLDLAIRGIGELRNGVPVCRCNIKPVEQKLEVSREGGKGGPGAGK